MLLKEMIFADRTKIRSYLIIVISVISVLLNPGFAEAQTRKTGGERGRTIDSLKQILKTSVQDTNRVNALNNLANEISRNNPDTAIIIAGQALSLSQQLKWKKGEALSEYRIGFIYKNKSNNKAALVHCNNALNICETLIISQNRADAITGGKLKVKILNNIAIVYRQQSNYSKALEFYSKGLKIAEKLGDKHQTGNILGNIANIYKDQSEYSKALEYYIENFKIVEQLGDKEGLGRVFSNIAGVYSSQSDYPKALEYYFKGLKISEETGDKRNVGGTFVSIASIYYFQLDYSKALEYYFKGLKIAEQLKDKRQIGATLGNLAAVYSDQLDYTKALEYFFKGLELSEETGDKHQVGITLGNIACVYINQGDSAVAKGNMPFAKADKYLKALDYFLKSLKISEEVQDKYTMGNTFRNIGHLYTALDKYKEAEDHLKRALLISKEIGAEDDIKSCHENLSDLYQKTNRPALALEHYKKFIALRDTIFSEENSKKLMRSEMDHEYEKKKAVTDAEHNMEIQNQKLITDEKNKKQNIIIGSVIAGLILVLIFAVFVFRSLRTTRKQKQIIELKNVETEHQKKEIEEHQKEILDSIHYAKRIQMAQIPSEKRVQSMIQKLKHN